MPGIMATSVGSVADDIAADGVPRVAEVATDDAAATAAVVHAGATRLTALMRPFGVRRRGRTSGIFFHALIVQAQFDSNMGPAAYPKVNQTDWAPYKDQQVRCSELLGCC